MRNLLFTSAALIAILGIVSGNLWLELRAARQELADMRAAQGQPVPAAPLQQAVPQQAAIAATAVPDASSQPWQTPPAVPAAEPAPAPAPVPQELVLVTRPAPVVTEAIRTSALLQSEQTATARVLAWKDRLAMAGHALTTEQLQVLNAAATSQLRREAEESLELASISQPTNLESAMRQREESLNRQHDTNMRILAAVSPHLSDEQSKALRAQFESGHAARMATFRAEQETIRQLQ